MINIFISNARLKFVKNQANAKQDPEAELLLFENYSLLIHVIAQNNTICSKYKQKNKCVCIHENM